MFFAAQEGNLKAVRFLLPKSVEHRIISFDETVDYFRNLAEGTKHAEIIERMNIILHHLQDNKSEKVLLKPMDIAFVMGHDSIVKLFIAYPFKQLFDKLHEIIISPTEKFICEYHLIKLQESYKTLKTFKLNDLSIENYEVFTKSCATALEKIKKILRIIKDDLV